MRHSATVKWIGLALVGLAIAAGVAIAASRLVSEQIGIASESVSAGNELAPAVRSAAGRPAGAGGDATTTPTTSTDPEPTVPAETTESDDHGGESSGGDDDSSGHGGGGSDD